MRVNFVTTADAQVASYRYHNQIPARELSLLGHTAVISQYPQLKMDFDTYVFSKHFNYGEYWYQDRMQKKGGKTVFHICDNHFGVTHDEFYRLMAKGVDLVLCSTEQMKAVIEKETEKEAVVIPDAYELAVAEPKYSGNLQSSLKVLWFGHQSNLQWLEKVLPLPDFCELRMCTRLTTPKGRQVALPIVFNNIPYLEWSMKNILFTLDWCDAVVIPSEINERTIVKSPNRMVEAIRRGKFVIASPLPCYLPYKEWMYIGHIHEGLKWLKEQSQEEITNRIRAAQAYVEEHHSPARIGRLWEAAVCK